MGRILLGVIDPLRRLKVKSLTNMRKTAQSRNTWIIWNSLPG